LNAADRTPPELEAAEAAIETLMNRVLKHPVMVVAARASISPAVVRVGDSLKVSIEFENLGTHPVSFVSPASFKAGSTNTFRLNFWTATGDTDDPYDYAWTLDLTGHELLVGEHETLLSRGPLVTLGPHETLKTWTTLKLPRCKAAAYQAELIYNPVRPSAFDPKDVRIFGELHADLVPLTVEKHKK
jgi:hypothetical protein